MSLTKRVFFFSILVFFISLLLWGVYNFSFKKPAAEPAAEKPVQSEPAKKIVPIEAISDEPILSPYYNSEKNNIRYFSQPNRNFYESELDGQNKKMLSDKEFSNISDILWSPDGNKAILKITDNDNKTRFEIYDFIQKKSIPAKENVDEIVWQTQGGKIFYKYYNPETKERSLNISDPDGSNWKKLADLSYKKVSIAAIPQSGLVSFWNYPNSFEPTIFESVPLIEGGERKMIFKDRYGADYLWSHSGDRVLISHTDQKGGLKMQTATINYNGGEYNNLGIPTFVSKMAWSKNDKFIYYAFPSGIPDNAILPDKYQEGEFKTTDSFWKIDMSSGNKERVLDTDEIEQQYDATNLFLNADESMLFFENKVDGKLYRINL